jgi:hypothetical protein
LRRSIKIVALWLVILGALPSVLVAQEQGEVTQVTPNVLVCATSSGNVAASVGPDGALLVGTPSAASAGFINSEIIKRTKSSTRYLQVEPFLGMQNLGRMRRVSRSQKILQLLNSLIEIKLLLIRVLDSTCGEVIAKRLQ